MINSKSAHTIQSWLKAIIFCELSLIVVYFYYKLTGEAVGGTRDISRITADAGTLLIVLSFAMSGFSYFFNFLDKYLVYRKYIGLIGFYLTLVHVYYALVFALAHPDIALSTGSRVWSFIGAVFALTYFIQMTLVSNNWAIKILGGKAQRIILRFGYVALAATVIHFWIRKLPLWEDFMAGDFGSIPPLSLVVFVFAILAFLLRIAMEVMIRVKSQSKPETTEAK